MPILRRILIKKSKTNGQEYKRYVLDLCRGLRQALKYEQDLSYYLEMKNGEINLYFMEKDNRTLDDVGGRNYQFHLRENIRATDNSKGRMAQNGKIRIDSWRLTIPAKIWNEIEGRDKSRLIKIDIDNTEFEIQDKKYKAYMKIQLFPVLK